MMTIFLQPLMLLSEILAECSRLAAGGGAGALRQVGIDDADAGVDEAARHQPMLARSRSRSSSLRRQRVRVQVGPVIAQRAAQEIGASAPGLLLAAPGQQVQSASATSGWASSTSAWSRSASA